MTKLKVPLLSLDARGRLSKLFTFASRQRQHIIEAIPIPADAKSSNQLFYRSMFTQCADLWHTLSEAEKQQWEADARPQHMTGYAWWLSSCLRPNPGIYLPLLGGTMQGDIDLDSNRLLNLIDPALDQEPVTKKYFEDNLPVGGYTEGARAHHTAAQSIPNATWTNLALNSERYDTDAIHDPVVNNSRLTCKTAGKYIITSSIMFAASAIGERHSRIRLNNLVNIVNQNYDTMAAGTPIIFLSTIYALIVGDYLEVGVWQNTGGNLNSNVIANHSPEFSMQRVG